MTKDIEKLNYDLEKLNKLHIALDRIGTTIYPSDYSKIFIKILVSEIIRLHDNVEVIILNNSSLQILDIINENIRNILKNSAVRSLHNVDHTIYDNFNEEVKKTIFSAHGSAPARTASNYFGERDRKLNIYSPEGDIGLIFGSGNDLKTLVFGNASEILYEVEFNTDGSLLSYKDFSISKHDNLVESDKSKISFYEPPVFSNIESKPEQDIGIFPTIIGSFAMAIIGNFLSRKKMQQNKKHTARYVEEGAQESILIEDKVEKYL